MQEAKLDAILKHPKRIAQVAEDVARHFVEHVRPNGFKGMLVCRDKAMCALYKVALDAELQRRVGGEDLTEMTRIIISEDPTGDSELVKPHSWVTFARLRSRISKNPLRRIRLNGSGRRTGSTARRS
jgi:type I restriction enzyme R subunit